MKKCENCGFENKDNFNFCMKCGARLPVVKKISLPPPPKATIQPSKSIEHEEKVVQPTTVNTVQTVQTKAQNQPIKETQRVVQNISIQPLKLKKRGFFASITYFICNILWFLICGLSMSIYYIVKGICLFITIIGIPFATQCFKFPQLLFAPFGRVVITHFGKHAIFNVLWIIFGGFFEWLFFLIAGLFLCITIIGIPVGLQAFKMAKLFLIPFGAEILKTEDYVNRSKSTGYTKQLENTISAMNNTQNITSGSVLSTRESYIENQTTEEFTELELAEKEKAVNQCLLDLLVKVQKLKTTRNVLFFLLFLVLVVAVGYLFLGTTAISSTM